MSHARWGVVGLGRAGQARIRAIAARPHLQLAGTVGRRPGRGDTTLDALCADPTVDGVIVCSENAHHGEAARRILHAGKHAIVEFPLAATAAEAADLFTLARRVGRVLHTEVFGLITARHAALREAWRDRPPAIVESRFTGRSYRWVADEARAGRIGQLAVGRLHALTDLLGPLTLDDVRCDRDERGYHLVARLTAADGARVVLDEQRGPELARRGHLTARLPGGEVVEPPTVDRRGDLFGRDLDIALRRCAGEADAAYVSNQAIVDVLALAEQISARATAERNPPI